MRNEPRKIVLLSGASSGIGLATARLLAAEGYGLVLVARRADRLAALAEELAPLAPVWTQALDLRDKEGVLSLPARLPEDFARVDVLINNAGAGLGVGPIHEADLDHWDATLDLNVKGLLYLTRAFTPGMVARGAGHVVNIGSVASREVAPGCNVYCASKHAVEALTKATRLDLLPHGIRVTQISPGMVQTEFTLARHQGDAQKAMQSYQGYQPLDPADVAQAILFALSRPANVNINDIVLTCLAQADINHILKR